MGSTFVSDDVLHEYCHRHLKVTPVPFDSLFEVVDEVVFLRESVLDILMDLLCDTKSTGSPISFTAPLNSELKIRFKAEFRMTLQSRIRKLLKLGTLLLTEWEGAAMGVEEESDFKDLLGYDLESFPEMAKWFVENNFADPVMMKIKNEPRKVGKVPRLINMVSSLANTIARLTLHNLLVKEQADTTSHVAVALDLVTRDSTRRLYETFVANAPLYSSDIRGWEWEIDPQMHWDDFYMKAHRMGLAHSGRPVKGTSRGHLALLMGAYYVELNSVRQTPEGDLLMSGPGDGISGKLNTFSSNSEERSLLSYRVAHLRGAADDFWCLSAGDDNEENVNSSAEDYKRFGYHITDQEVCTREFTFCSTHFGPEGSYMENIEKFFVNCMYDQDSWAEKMLQFEILFKLHPEYLHYAALLNANLPTPVVVG